MCCGVKEQFDQGTAGESEKQHGGVDVDGFVELCFGLRVFLVRLGLACLLAFWGGGGI